MNCFHYTHFLVNGIAYPNELLAILGSSGAGKTTLLNALTYRTTKNVVVSGTRCVNGTPVNSKSLTSVSGYVQQDDLFIPTLTVKEHLIFQVITFSFYSEYQMWGIFHSFCQCLKKWGIFHITIFFQYGVDRNMWYCLQPPNWLLSKDWHGNVRTFSQDKWYNY